MTDARYVTLVSAKPPVRVKALRGASPPVPAGGFSGWTTVARPRRKSLTVWEGLEPLELALPLLLDGHAGDRSIERACGDLERLTRPTANGEAPIVRALGALPHSRVNWVVRDLEWDANPLYSRKGYRTRQAVVVRLLEYVADDRLGGSSAADRVRAAALEKAATGKGAPGAKTHVVKAGETLSSIAAKRLGNYKRWPEIAELNGIRDPKSLQVGQVLRLP